MNYLFAAYAVFWAVTFIFVFSLTRRQRHLEQELEFLKRTLENRIEEE